MNLQYLISEHGTKNRNLQSVLKRNLPVNETHLCPHKAVMYLANIGDAEYEGDRRKYVSMQTRLGFVLFGVLGEDKLVQFGYPNKTVTEILESVLCKTNTKVSYCDLQLVAYFTYNTLD